MTMSLADTEDPTVTTIQFKMLVVDGTKDITAMATALQTKEAALQDRIMSLLRNYGRFWLASDNVRRFLVNQFDDHDPVARIGAIHGLTEFKSPQVFTLLIGALDDEDAAIRTAAIRALTGYNDQGAVVVPKLIAALSDDAPTVRRAAAFELQGYPPHKADAVSALVDALDDPDREIRANAVGSLGVDGPESLKAIPRIVSLLHDSEPNVRSAAANAIAAIDRSAIGPILEKLKTIKQASQTDHIVRALASSALREMGA